MTYTLLAVAVLTTVAFATPYALAAEPSVPLAVTFTVNSPAPYGGAYVATLTYKKGALSGSMIMPAKGLNICNLQPGSTDIKKQLSLTCYDAFGGFYFTFVGTLSTVTGKGRGAFTGPLPYWNGTYTAVKTN